MKPKDDNHWTSNGPQVEFPVQQKGFFPPPRHKQKSLIIIWFAYIIYWTNLLHFKGYLPLLSLEIPNEFLNFYHSEVNNCQTWEVFLELGTT